MRAIPLLLTTLGILMTDTSFGAPATTPEARVRAFIADFHRAHLAAQRIIDAGDFGAWKKVITRIDEAHFVDGARSGLDGVMSGEPEHHPDSEKVTSHTALGNIVQIQTHDPDSQITDYYEYDLRQVDGDWRIVALRGYVESPDEIFISSKEKARFEKPRMHPFRALPKNEAALDGTTMFVPGRHVERGKDRGNIEVRRVGTLNVTTGVLVVGDLGYDAFMLSPLGQRIPPGQYPVEVSIAFKHVAAMRLRLSDKPVVKWHPADMGDDPGHVVGVDAGNVSISDVSGLMIITTRRKEKEFESFAQAAGDLTAARMLTLTNPNDCAVAMSGYGDGAYPVYWGLDATGKPAVLLVDMLVLSDPGEDE